MAVSPDLLREFLNYCPDTGQLTWKPRQQEHFADGRSCKSWNSKYAGTPALTYVDQNGYCVGNILGRPYKAHRVAWAIVHGEWPEEIDHQDGDRANNALSNLRDVGREENAKNLKRRSDNVSGVPGVGRHQGGWRMRISSGGRVVASDTFRCWATAVRSARAAHARLGFHENHGREAT